MLRLTVKVSRNSDSIMNGTVSPVCVCVCVYVFVCVCVCVCMRVKVSHTSDSVVNGTVSPQIATVLPQYISHLVTVIRVQRAVRNVLAALQTCKRKNNTACSQYHPDGRISNSDRLVKSFLAVVNVTCCYYSSIPVANELHLASRESKSCLISGGDSS